MPWDREFRRETPSTKGTIACEGNHCLQGVLPSGRQPKMAYQEEIALLRREPPDVMLCNRIIQSLQEENAQLKGRIILQMAELAAIKLQIKAVPGL
jgi:hypothetical protein